MSKKGVVDEFLPQKDIKLIERRNRLITEFVADKGCTYPAEISRELGISRETAYTYLYQLEKAGAIKKHNLSRSLSLPDWLKPRIEEFFDIGLKGKSLKRISWYTLPVEEKKDV